MSWTCNRCNRENDDDEATSCYNCHASNPLISEGDRLQDWVCPNCGTENGGGFTRCFKCDERRP